MRKWLGGGTNDRSPLLVSGVAIGVGDVPKAVAKVVDAAVELRFEICVSAEE